MNIQETKLFSGTHASVRHLPPPAGLQHSSNSYIRIQPSITKDLYNEGPCFMFKPFFAKRKKRKKTLHLLLRKRGKKFASLPDCHADSFFLQKKNGLESPFLLLSSAAFLFPFSAPYGCRAPFRSGESAATGRGGHRRAALSPGASPPPSIGQVRAPIPFTSLSSCAGSNAQSPPPLMYAMRIPNFGSDLVFYLLNFDFLQQLSGRANMCPVLGPPLLAAWLIQIRALTMQSCLLTLACPEVD